MIPNIMTMPNLANATGTRRGPSAMIRLAGVGGLVLVAAAGGCVKVTSRSTNSARTGTEQLLMTGATDRAIGSIDFSPLAGHKVFLSPATASTDADWINFSLRREMARQGVLLAADKADAQMIVESAIGAYGTDEVDKSVSLPTNFSVGMLPLPLPTGNTGSSSTSGSNDSGFYRRQRQSSVVKLALFAYDASTRQMVWDSNTVIGQGDLDRKYLGTSNFSRKTSEPELDAYPPRGIIR